jgi:hydrogenase 3 maturation protease
MAQSLKTLLKNRLSGAGSVVVLGVGSSLRADDAAGLLVAENLKSLLKHRSLSRRVKIILGCTAPENMTGEIRRFKPTHVIIVDCAQMGRKAGTSLLIEPEAINGVSFSTHQLPLEIFIRYLSQEIGCDSVVVGMEPKNIKFGTVVSPAVMASARKLARTLADVLLKK